MILNSLKQAGLWCSLLSVIWAAGCSKSRESAKSADHAGAAANPQLQKVDFQLDWYAAPEHGGEYEAVAKGYYRQAGLDVAILQGGPGSYGIQKVATGRVQLAMGACDDVIMAVKQGAPLLVVGGHMEHNPQAIMVHDESPVRTFKDLDGKTVMCVPGSNWIEYVQKHYAIRFNVAPSDYGMARFMADKGFIQQCFITNEPFYAELHGAKTRAMLIADSGYDPYRVIFTSRSFAREHPDVVRAFVAETSRGWSEFLHGDAAAARARIQSDDPSQTPALIDYCMAAMKRYKLAEGDPAKGERACMLTPERMTKLMQTLVDLGILASPMPLDDFVSFDFLPPEPRQAKT
jgi:NitT/TauT family transport system substrate-binding protein